MKSPLCLLLVAGILQQQQQSVGGSPVPAGGVVYAAAPEERGAFHVGGKGVYNYGYNTGDGIAKVEVRHGDGSVTGSYRYFDPNGRQIVRSYIADSRGFRVLGNDLPVAPDTPAIGYINDQVLTGPVEGTQEFSSPDLVTNDKTAFVFSNRAPGQFTSASASSGNTVAETQLASQQERTLSRQQSEILRRQEELIRQQEKKLEELKLQQRRYVQQHEQQLSELKRLQEQQKQHQQQSIQHQQQSIQHQQQYKHHQQPQFQHGYSTSFSKVFGLESPYFYSDDNINYDFPAGFAYNVQPVHVANPVAVKGEHAKLLVTAGHGANIFNQGQDHSSYYSNRKSPFHKHPYVIGHKG